MQWKTPRKNYPRSGTGEQQTGGSGVWTTALARRTVFPAPVSSASTLHDTFLQERPKHGGFGPGGPGFLNENEGHFTFAITCFPPFIDSLPADSLYCLFSDCSVKAFFFQVVSQQPKRHRCSGISPRLRSDTPPCRTGPIYLCSARNGKNVSSRPEWRNPIASFDLVLDGINTVTYRGGRGARQARREEGEYREYLTDEQRSLSGWIGLRMRSYLCHRVLSQQPKRTVTP